MPSASPCSNSKLKSLTVPRSRTSPSSSPGRSRPATSSSSSAPSTPTRTRVKTNSDSSTFLASAQKISNNSSSVIEKKDFSSEREAAHLNRILRNLHFTFKNCTFTFRDPHLKKTNDTPSSRTKPKKSSIFKKFKNGVRATLDRLSDVVGVTEETVFNNCIFVPKSREDEVQHFIRQNFSDIPIKFEMCKFVNRESSLLEQVTRRLRKFFGIIFELTEMPGVSIAEVEECTFRLKDLSSVTNFIQERIVDKYYSS